MAKTANINIRIDPETKSSAEKLFASFGITITDAINIFLRKSIMEGGLPFEVKQPRYNIETERVLLRYFYPQRHPLLFLSYHLIRSST